MQFIVFFVSALCCFVQAIPKEGLLSGFLVEGDKAKVGQFPYLASIRINGVHYCAGSILNKRWILTAAQCKLNVPLHQYSVIVGSTRLNVGGRKYDLEDFIVHDDYNAIDHDIAIIKTRDDIEFAASVNAVSLPKFDISDDEYVIGSGWGYTNIPSTTPNDLMWLYLMTLNNKICNIKHQQYNVNESHLCTYKSKGYALCTVDSGSPVTANGIVYGIAIWSQSCSLNEQPNIFTNVYAHRKWINFIIN